MIDQPFSIARLPRIEFGPGMLSKLPRLAANFGNRALLVTGAKSFPDSSYWEALQADLSKQGVSWSQFTVDDEPSPHLIDDAVTQYRDANFDVVIGIGGGSALDAAKGIAGLLRVQRSVMDYLEGVGPELPYAGPAVPLIAVPTTAGTGSEATKNAVLSKRGLDGFKKSFRHDKLVAEYAVVDPSLLASCPKAVIAANGMDALTQLIESVVSLRANAFTDALAISGIKAVRDSLLPWFEGESKDPETLSKMAYAALISGITLAQTGLGSVHGLASPLGAFFPIPHGVVCGTLVATATEVNIKALGERDPNNPALKKYAKIAELLYEQHLGNPEKAWDALIRVLGKWTERLKLPRLSAYGVAPESLDHIVAHSRGSSMRTNPIVLTDREIKEILLQRI